MSATIPATLPVEFTERVVHLSGLMEAYRPQLGGVASFDSRLDATRLERALRLLLDAEPVLGCRFVSDAMPPVWERLEVLDSVEVLDLREDDDPESAAAAFIADPMDAGAGPQLHAALVRGPTADMLAVRVGHCAMDGGALKETLYLIGEIYRTLEREPDWTPEPNVDGVRAAVTRATLSEKMRASRQNDLTPPPSDWGTPLLGGRGPASYVTACVEPEVLRRAAELAKSANATVNDVVLAAYYRTTWRLLGAVPGDRTPVMMTSDLRRHLPPSTKTALSNISSAFWIAVSPAEDESFDQTLARVVEVTGAWKRAGAGKGTAIGLPVVHKLTRRRSMEFIRKMMFGKIDAEADSQTGAVLVTNIGVIDADRLGFGPSAAIADAWLLAPATHMGIALGVSTYRDRLHLAVGVEFASVDERLVTDVVNGTRQEIESWVA